MSTIELTAAQQQALGQDDRAVVSNPRTNKAYVLVPTEEYERLRESIAEEQRRAFIHGAAIRNATGG